MGVLPVGKKEGERKGKNGIGPRMKNGCANHKQNTAFTNNGYSITCHLLLFSCTRPLSQFCVSLSGCTIPALLVLSSFFSLLYNMSFLSTSGIQLGLESNNSTYFFIGSYTNNSRSGEFLMNSQAGSSYSPNLG